MKLTKIYIIFLGLIFCLNSYSQTTELRKIDNELTNTYKKMVSVNYELRIDSLSPFFEKQILTQLKNPITFDNSLDSLSKYITIKSSADKNVKFYCWDDLSGGTWHNINCLAQFKSDKGQIIIQQLNSENATDTCNYTDSGVYEVNEIIINKSTYYLIFAWGTHGSGNQHNIIQIFSISGDKLVKCKSCFANRNDLVIEYPRGQKLNLTFIPKTNEISYNEFEQDNDNGFYKSTGKTIILELNNGVFTIKSDTIIPKHQ